MRGIVGDTGQSLWGEVYGVRSWLWSIGTAHFYKQMNSLWGQAVGLFTFARAVSHALES